MSNKTDLSKAGLEKGLKALEAAAVSPDQSRRRELFQKSEDGTITAEENEELMKSLSKPLSARATEDLTTDSMQKSINVSDYLKEQHAGLTNGLEVLADHIQKSENRDQEFRVALATTLFHQGELLKAQTARADAAEEMLKSIQERLGVIVAQPARGPKSVAGANAAANAAGGPNAMQKSQFAGQPGGGVGLSKADILNTMSDMIQKGAEQAAGETLMLSAIKYESMNEISPAMLEAVQAHRRGNKAA